MNIIKIGAVLGGVFEIFSHDGYNNPVCLA